MREKSWQRGGLRRKEKKKGRCPNVEVGDADLGEEEPEPQTLSASLRPGRAI